MKLGALFELAKPRITAMVVATYAVGAWMAGAASVARRLSGLVGTVMIVAAANAFNMWLERDCDARMERTRRRPLPEGRVSPGAALTFAAMCLVVSLPWLALAGLTVVALGLAAFVLYVVVYTPLKRRSMLALPVGAIAGALPPLMGRVAAIGAVDATGLYLFAVLFVWQMPHFLAIALARGDEYASAGLHIGASGRVREVTLALRVFALSMVGLTALSPWALGIGPVGATFAVVASAWLLVLALRIDGTLVGARRVFLGSMAQLVLVFVGFWVGA